MFKFNIYKKEIELLCELLEKNNLTELEIKNGNKSIKLSKILTRILLLVQRKKIFQIKKKIKQIMQVRAQLLI